MRFWLTKNIHLLLLSIIVVPVESEQHFLNLEYSKGISNQVEFGKNLSIAVENSASPLFYRLDDVKKLKKILVKGRVNIIRPINKDKDDSYFQLGIIYKGDFRPNSFIKFFLPDWLEKVVSLHSEHGVSSIHFHEVSAYGKKLNREEKVRGIVMKFKTALSLNQDRTFQLEIIPEDKEVLGFWLRSDGDNSKAKFTTQISALSFD